MRAAVLPYGCRTIGNRAFEGCAGLSFVRISDSVTAIGDGAFRNCPHLETVTLPRSLTRIGPGAFDDAVTARVYRDSFAHQWCIDNGIPFELIAGGDSGSAPSAEELEQAREDMPEDILDVQSRFEDGDGYVSGANRAAAIAAVAEYLDGEKAAGHIDEFDIDGRQILYVDAASREVWAWAPPMRGLMAGGDGITSSVVTLQAFDFGKAQWGQSITDKLDNFVGEPIYEDLTPEYVETKLGPNQVVIFMTHGLAYGNFNVLTTART